MSAGWNQSHLLSVVAERTLKRSTIFFIALNYTEWAGYYAVRASIANVRLYVHTAKFSSYNRTRWTSLEASRIFAVFANVRRKSPRRMLGAIATMAYFGRMLDKFHMAPR